MRPPEHRISTGVLVIGAGGGGLRAAIALVERGVDVLVVGKRAPRDAHTSPAAGGISAALATTNPRDSWQHHAADTLVGGHFLGDPRAVRILTAGAASAIADLEAYGMPFTREPDGGISPRCFGAHTHRRTALAGDSTGLEVRRALLRRATELQTAILHDVYITRVLVDHGVARGAYGFDLSDGSRYVITASAVILATGGHTALWHRTSSRCDENMGDTVRLAVEAGARIRDPELVQFHPSGLLGPAALAGQAVSEAARGEGGILRNALGERFMSRYDPRRMELSTRGRVALACDTEIREGRGTAGGGVLLDLSHVPRERIMRWLPRLYETLLELQGLDITTTPIEVAPTAHYAMGGVWVRPDDGSTDVDGLYAVGEAASGVHGANRLGGNSLVELLVYGRIVGNAAASYTARVRCRPPPAGVVADAAAQIDAAVGCNCGEQVRRLRHSLRAAMSRHAGVVRSEAGLMLGLHELRAIESCVPDVTVNVESGGVPELAHAFDLRSSVVAARATLEAALVRRESRGCHNRSDHPALDPSLEVNLVWSGPGRIARERVPPVPDDIAELIHEVSRASAPLGQP
jgi:succinate dehydrogenase flavoprotein subunit